LTNRWCNYIRLPLFLARSFFLLRMQSRGLRNARFW
jgi:hypothetical protein